MMGAVQPTGGSDALREARKSEYGGAWALGMGEAPLREPAYCLYAALCAPCASYGLRKRFLRGDMSRYVACGGYLPCSGACGEASCPELVLAGETIVCFPTSVAVTRFMLQDQMRIRNTAWDNAILACQYSLAQAACLCQCAACITGNDELRGVANCMACAADCVFCTMCACMQAQHHAALKARDAEEGRIPATTVMAPPSPLGMARDDKGGVFTPPPPPAVYPHALPAGAKA